ncbi:unnamed protein product [Phytophthora lilii]|uniref:Unnamed protein product n=1 Tax=Phytophthora lilii TaxID=2077276 RepID=A0A9W6TMV2_9STRA|nr:unnamed protein product [Phytophthora lilii]
MTPILDRSNVEMIDDIEISQNELDKIVAFSTWIKLLRDFSDQFNEREAKRCWNELNIETNEADRFNGKYRLDVDKPCTLGPSGKLSRRKTKTATKRGA